MRTIPDPGFAGDDGSVDAEVTAALAAYEADPRAGYHPALAVLQDRRVLVPIVAAPADTPAPEPVGGKTTEMAAVLMTGRDGRTALLAFTGTAALTTWNPQARPVPVTVPDAARAAREDGADALLVDVAGPVLLVVEGEDLRALAEGSRLAPVGEHWAWLRPGA